MKCYFDTIEEHTPNLHHLSTNADSTWWLIPSGSTIKKHLRAAGATISTTDAISEPGCYIIDVNGDPNWWSGQGFSATAPARHLLFEVPKYIVTLVKEKKLRLIIAADREGGPMKTDYIDAFKTTTDAMVDIGLPAGSVLIMQGNKKIEEQYERWLNDSNNHRMFDVMYSNHFGRIFFDNSLPQSAITLQSVSNINAVSYNSLNRIYRTHRGTHLYTLIDNDMLDKGLVSGNEINFFDREASSFLKIDERHYYDRMKQHFPKFIDGDWSQENAANQYNLSIYENSLMSFITETKFDQDVVFLTEKVFKPIAIGHPMIVLASAGTLRGLEDLGFKINWCGIDPGYNDIEDDYERFVKTHEVLFNWINLSREDKNSLLLRSTDVINHNFNLIRDTDFYKTALEEALRRTKDYFRNA